MLTNLGKTIADRNSDFARSANIPDNVWVGDNSVTYEDITIGCECQVWSFLTFTRHYTKNTIRTINTVSYLEILK